MRETRSRVEDDGSITVAPLTLLNVVPTRCIYNDSIVGVLDLGCNACQHNNFIL